MSPESKPERIIGWVSCLIAAVLVLVSGCSRSEPPATEAPGDPAGAVEQAGLVNTSPCPFAVEIKQAVLREMLGRLADAADGALMYVLEDPEHGDELVQRMAGEEPVLTNKVVVALEDGVVVERDSRNPVIMCAVKVGSWTEEEVSAEGIWYAADQREGREPFTVVKKQAQWVIDTKETK